MTEQDFKEFIKNIVARANGLKNKYTGEKNAPVNYSAIFCQNETEYKNFYKSASQIGKVVLNTQTGDLFKIRPIETDAGRLQLLKIRKPDATRPERGDADFTIEDYLNFKAKYLRKSVFKLIKRENFEMIELMDAEFNVRTYFSNPPVTKQLGI